MKKRILSALLVCLMCLTLAVPAFAEHSETDIHNLTVWDQADLLRQEEENRLAAKLERVSKTYDAQIVVVTKDTIGNSDIDNYVEELFDGNGFGYGENHDGILLLIVMDIREFRILSNGAANNAISYREITRITDAITPALSDGDYAEAFAEFADQCEYYLDGYINGFPFAFGKTLLIALAVGLAVGLIVAFSLKAQLKSVRSQNQADTYIKPGSMHLTGHSDLYLYRHVTRTRRESSSSRSGSSRSGGSRSVGGGSF